MKNKIVYQNTVVTRFAPSPSGYLHLGHAYSAWFAERIATEAGGKFLLRIENIDYSRCRPEYEKAILTDLNWLGLKWEKPVRRQSDYMEEYASELARLTEMNLIYPCFCTRKEIRREVNNITAAPHEKVTDNLGVFYPGTCRKLNLYDRKKKIASGQPYALRLNMKKAVDQAIQKCKTLNWLDLDAGLQSATPEIFGDAVIARKDYPTSYHLSVVTDDASQGVNLITRGEDLRDVTHIHCLLQALLGLESPSYKFHRVLVDSTGKRFAKRDKSLTLRKLREDGMTLAEVRKMVDFF